MWVSSRIHSSVPRWIFTGPGSPLVLCRKSLLLVGKPGAHRDNQRRAWRTHAALAGSRFGRKTRVIVKVAMDNNPEEQAMTMRSTGGNRLGPNSGKLTTYGRNETGQKTKIVTDRANDRVDTYWGGKSKTDGPGHGHSWDNRRDGQTGTRKPR